MRPVDVKKAKPSKAKKAKVYQIDDVLGEKRTVRLVDVKKAKPAKKVELSKWDKNKISILEQMSLAPLVDVAKTSGIDAKETWSKLKIINELKKSENLTPGLILYVLSKRIETPMIKKIKEEVSKYL